MIQLQDRPTFSVVVPVYNAEKYLSECVDSILNQSYSDFEIILVDDGSKDSSLEICKKYETIDKRVRVIHKTNGGVSSARNTGIKEAKGQYITFIDSDDWIVDGSFEYIAKQCKSHRADFISGQIVKIAPQKTFVYKKLTDGQKLTEDCVKHLGGCFISLDVIKDNNLKFTEGLAYSEDRVFLCEVTLHCKSVATYSKNIYIYRISENSVTNSIDGKRIMENQFKASRLLFRMANNPKYAKSRKRLLKHAQKTMKWGIYAIVKHSPNKKNYQNMKSMFSDLFSCEYEHPLITYYRLLLTRHYLVYKQAISRKLTLASRMLMTCLF